MTAKMDGGVPTTEEDSNEQKFMGETAEEMAVSCQSINQSINQSTGLSAWQLKARLKHAYS